MSQRDFKAEWPPEELESVSSCPVCNCTDRGQLHAGLTDNVFFAAPGRWTLWQCSACGAAYLDPRPNEASIGRAYESYYTHQDSESPPGPASLVQRIRAALGNGYRNARYGTQLYPALGVGDVMARLVPWFRAPNDQHFRWLPRAPTSRNVLDVGCGSGAWLEIARGAGWTIFGVEPDPVSREIAETKGIKVWPSIDEARQELPPVDYISLSHVIEHVHDPLALLQSCYDLLKPGAEIYIDTPNIDALGHRFYGKNWRGLETPRHLVLFDRNSLKRALEMTGFRSVSFKVARVFQGISRQSALIALGIDPYTRNAPPLKISRVLRLKAALTRRRTEFLTLTAVKPAHALS
jgi:SAM-dependent methyltransferase